MVTLASIIAQKADILGQVSDAEQEEKSDTLF